MSPDVQLAVEPYSRLSQVPQVNGAPATLNKHTTVASQEAKVCAVAFVTLSEGVIGGYMGHMLGNLVTYGSGGVIGSIVGSVAVAVLAASGCCGKLWSLREVCCGGDSSR